MTVLRRTPLVLRPLRSYHHHSTNSGHSGKGISHPNGRKLTVGIRREDPTRIWERRCPLTPAAVHSLVHDEGVDVLVQPCERRVFHTREFLEAGAKLHPTLQPAHVLVGIKETPLAEVLTDPLPLAGAEDQLVARTHIMFSHTIKGQLYNMPLLSKYLASEFPDALAQDGQPLPRLVDYEMLTDGERGRRTVGFGWFAGVAGALEALSAMAHAHLELGVASPFLWTPRPHTRPSLESIRATLRDVVGAQIASDGTRKSLGPLVIGVTGTGKVAEGALDLLKDLPIQHIRVEELRSIVTDPNTDLHKIYVLHAHPRDYFVRRDGRAFDRDHYYAHPDEHTSEFHTKIAPYLSLLLHGAGWAPAFPRLMTNEQLTTTLEIARTLGKGRFACIGDISCDVEGGLEFLTRTTTLSDPFYTARPAGLPAHLPGVTMMAVDILPTALPLEASQHFSQAFLPYLKSIIRGYTHSTPGSGVRECEGQTREALERATVAKDGELYGQFGWLRRPLGIWKESVEDVAASSSTDAQQDPHEGSKPLEGPHAKRRVLMLGSGMVAPPAVAEICSRSDVELVVASNVLSDAERLTVPYANATPVLVDMSDAASVERLVQGADVVISLLPVPFHPAVAELCIRNRKHMVTASYISPAMRDLHERAMQEDVLLMNEIGLDPGIDHCSALSLIDSLRAQGKEVVSFTSFCGGLPAPEDADVPLGYKFSWSPKGVLSAAGNAATFKLNGETCHIPGSDLLKTYFPDVPLSNVLKFEGLANRDSIPYADVYGLEPLKDVRTVFRGTLRYPGFADLMHAFKKIGLLDADTASGIHLRSWNTLVRQVLEKKLGAVLMDDPASVRSALHDIIGQGESSGDVVAALEWLGLVPTGCSGTDIDVRGKWQHDSESSLVVPSPSQTASVAPIDLFATVLAHKLRYQPNERDLVVLSHEIVTRPRGSSAGLGEEIHTSSLIAYGTREASAMSRTVGLPVAFAALQILDGGVTLRGVQGPTTREVYGNVLAKLEGAGLKVRESSRKANGLGVETSLSNRWRAIEGRV